MSRTDVDAFLAQLDEVVAPTCGACAQPLTADGPSLDFCDAECSASWHRTQGEPLVGYREPWERPDEFPGVGGEAYQPSTPGVPIEEYSRWQFLLPLREWRPIQVEASPPEDDPTSPVPGVISRGWVVRDPSGQRPTRVTGWAVNSRFTGRLDPDWLVEHFPDREITWEAYDPFDWNVGEGVSP